MNEALMFGISRVIPKITKELLAEAREWCEVKNGAIPAGAVIALLNHIDSLTEGQVKNGAIKVDSH